jgi:DNA polymerase III epsilon subunit-like protein
MQTFSPSRRQIMVDLETLSTRPYSTILAIGAVSFTIEDGVLDTFYTNVDANSCKEIGLHISKDSVDWWARQSKEAREALTVNPIPVADALTKFSEWYGTDKYAPIWGNSSAFDISILESAYYNADIEIPWTPWVVSCYRTVLNLLNLNNKSLWDADKTNTGVAHNALDDAMHQTKQIIKVFKK